MKRLLIGNKKQIDTLNKNFSGFSPVFISNLLNPLVLTSINQIIAKTSYIILINIVVSYQPAKKKTLLFTKLKLSNNKIF